MSESGEVANISSNISGGTDSGNAESEGTDESQNANTYGGSAKNKKNLTDTTDKELERIFNIIIKNFQEDPSNLNDILRINNPDLENIKNNQKLRDELAKKLEEDSRVKDLRADRHADREKSRTRRKEIKNKHKRNERKSRQLVNRRRTPNTDLKLPYAKAAERPPKVPEAPQTEIKNVDEIFGKILDKWGKTANEIVLNLNKALKTDAAKVFSDLAALIDAHRLDLMLEDEAFQNNSEVHKLKIVLDEVKKAFTDITHKSDILYRKHDTNQPLAFITTTEKRHKFQANISRERNKSYTTFTPTHMVNTLMFLRGKKPEINDLSRARETLEHFIKDTKMEIDPFLSEAPDLDDRIAPVNSYLSDMRDTFLDADNALNKEKIKSKLIETLMREHNITREQAKKVLEEAGSVTQRSISFFDTLQEYDISQKLFAVQEMSTPSE